MKISQSPVIIVVAAAAALCPGVSARAQRIRDLAIDHVEITQGLQDGDNGISLVLDRPTVIRVFPRVVDCGAPIPGVSAVLHAGRNGVELPGSPIDPDNGPITVDDAPADRADPDDSLNFWLEPDWYAEDTCFYVRVTVSASVCYELPHNNSAQLAASYNDRRGLSIQYLLVNYTNEDWTGPDLPRDRVRGQFACEYLRSLYPVDPLEMPYDAWTPDEIEFDEGDAMGNLDGDELITELNTLYAANPDPPDRLYAWTPAMAYPSNGLSDPLWAGGQGHVAFGNDTGSDASPSLDWRWRRTFAHEIGHNTDASGLFHTSRRLEDDEFGFDVLVTDPFNRIVMRTYPASDPNPNLDLFDFMRGGEVEPHAWITPPYHTDVYNFLAPGGMMQVRETGAAAVAFQQVADDGAKPVELLVVRGKVTREGDGEFYPFYQVPVGNAGLRTADETPRGEGTHEVRFFRDAEEVRAARITWTPVFRNSAPAIKDEQTEDDTLPSRPFTWFVEAPAGITRVELLARGTVVDTLEVSANAPVLADVKSATANAEGRATATLTWDAQDADLREARAGELVHQVYYTNDDGATWRLVATGLETPEATVDLSNLPGGDECRFQIRTTDGYNVAILDAPTFPHGGPGVRVAIVSPPAGASIPAGRSVRLSGTARDASGQRIEADQLYWSSDVQGELGTGERVIARNLETGTHVIRLRVGTKEGAPVAEVEVEILARKE